MSASAKGSKLARGVGNELGYDRRRERIIGGAEVLENRPVTRGSCAPSTRSLPASGHRLGDVFGAD
jgi:hypothetical protein